MDTRRCTTRQLQLLGIASIALAVLAGCSGNDGAAGPAGQAATPTAAASTATSLSVSVTGVTISSPPVIRFRVNDQSGNGATGLTLNDLRFTVAKLVPGANGGPSTWQNYVNTVQSATSNIRATAEGGTSGTSISGTLVDNGDGSYTYTFKTDITNATCPVSPCTNAAGQTLDLSYKPGLPHRFGIQTRGTLPIVNAVYDLQPSTGATTGLYKREIVATTKCNECHNKLAAHGGSRVETKFCVTCHNPGSSTTGQIGTSSTNLTVDFKVYIHKIHRGASLPSVLGADGVAGTADDGKYMIGTSDFSTVVFPQDIRNCTKCHDGANATTPQGDNWKTQPSMEACGSCHDNVNFATGANHPGGVQISNSTCYGCHSTGGMAGPIETSHSIPAKVAGAKFKFDVISVTGGATPVIQISVTDPTNSNAAYDIASGTATTNPVFKTPSTSRLAIDIAWNTSDFTNNASGTNPAQPLSINPVDACDGTPIADWSCSVSGGVYTLTKSTPLPAGATGTGRVGFEGHTAAQDSTGAWTVSVPVKSVVKDWAISGTVTARRTVVDVAKCDKCHDQLSLHGGNRNDEPQLCAICHNPYDTDVNRRPKTGAGIPDTVAAIDGKKMEAIDFKRMIHGIHAAAKTSLNGATTLYGFRNKGIVVYGFGNVANDFSDIRFPGILNDCTACHTNTSSTSGVGTYELTGIWDPSSSTFGTVMGSTIDAAPTATDATTLASQLADQTDDLKISPTAAVCSSCHDGTTSQVHMQSYGALFSATQTTISGGATLETCAICHGPGRTADVKTMHSIQ